MLACLRDLGLQLKAKKCTFMQTEVIFLGHIVGETDRRVPHQLDLRTGQLWAEGRSTLQMHQERLILKCMGF